MHFFKKQEAVGSIISVEIIDEDEQVAQTKSDLFFEMIRVLEKKYSRFDEKSILSELNKHLQEWYQVDPDFLELLTLAELLKKETQGYFDIGMEKVLSGLGYDKNFSFISTQSSFEFESKIQFGKGEIKIETPIELGGLIKGYILDKAAEIFAGVENICVDAGGDLWVKGYNKAHEPWKILLEHPTDNALVIGEVKSTALFLACSSPTKRKWAQHHHLINPKEKKSASEMQAVFTQGQSGIWTDALATALFVMGYEQAKAYLQKERVVEALLISQKGQMFKTNLFQAEFY